MLADGRLRHFLARFNGFQMLGRKSFHSGPLVLPLGLLRPSQIVRTPPTRPEACSPAALLGHHPSKANGPVGAIDRDWDHVTRVIHKDEWTRPMPDGYEEARCPPPPPNPYAICYQAGICMMTSEGRIRYIFRNAVLRLIKASCRQRSYMRELAMDGKQALRLRGGPARLLL